MDTNEDLYQTFTQGTPMLTSITDNLWTTPAPLKVFGIIELNTRMTVIRLENGELVLHSPVRWTPELNETVAALGQIQAIIAPSCFHHLFVGEWKEHHPDAKLFAPKGLRRKREDLQFDGLLNGDNAPQWKEIDLVEIKGMPIVQEHLLYHKPSKTLIITDFCFYLPEATGFTRFYAWLNGVLNKVGVPILFKSAIKDKQAFAASVRPLLGLEIERLSMCHHIVLDTEAKSSLASALQNIGIQ